jgi:translation initiation factor IF-2
MRRALGIGRGVVVMVVAASLVTVSFAQPPERPEGPPDRGGPAAGRGGPREGRGGPGGGGPGGPPSPERFVEHAMKFDADGDGKLDREELTKFAEDIQRMRGGPGAGRGGSGDRGGRGERGPGPGPGGFGGPGSGSGGPPGSPDGDRPPRPRRPE